jgi:hypothetical protein
MNLAGILFTIAVIVLIYIIIRYFFRKNNALSGVSSGDVMQTFTASNLETNGTGNANNFAYSIWFYIQDWNYRYGEPKVIFGRMNSASSSPSNGSLPGISGVDPSPVVYLDPLENNVVVALGCYPGANQIPNGIDNGDGPSVGDSVLNLCQVNNVAIQRWVNLVVSVYGRTLDVYIDGKLVKTCLLPGVAMINTNANVLLTPGGGFNGWTSKLQYFANPINPQQAWNIYTKGYGNSIFNNNYQVKVSFDENGTTKSSFTI